MNKKILVSGLAAVFALYMVGCGSTDKDAYLSGIKAEDYVDLCEYNGIPVEEAQPSVTDDYVEMYINYNLSSSASYKEITDRDTVKDGDVVNIDYDGTIDGAEFDGGSSTGYNLTIGSGSFIDGFEDGLIGKKVGATVSLNLTFPDDYSNTDVAGKDVVFKVTINSIEELVTPELTDDWVAEQNIDGVTTADEYREYTKKQLLTQAQSTYDSDVQSAITTYLQDNCTFRKDPPQAMVDRFSDYVLDYYTQYANQYGMDLESFMQYVSPTEETDAVEDTEAASGDASEAASSDESAAEATSAAATTDAATEATSVALDTSVEQAESEDSAATATSATDAAATASTTTDAAAAASSGEESVAAASSEPAYMKTINEQAAKMAKNYIIMQAIADKENLGVSKRDFNKKLSSEAASEGYSSVADYKKSEDEEAYYESLMIDNVMKFLTDNAVITEPAADDSSTGSSATDSSSAATSEDAAAEATS